MDEMSNNEASWDRIARIVVGIALIAGGLLVIGGVWGWIAAAAGLVLVVTGAVGWCPIYSMLRTGTKRSAEHQSTNA